MRTKRWPTSGSKKNKSAQRAVKEEYNRKLEEAKGAVNKMIADVDGEYLKAQIDADAHFVKQKLIAEAIKTEAFLQTSDLAKIFPNICTTFRTTTNTVDHWHLY